MYPLTSALPTHHIFSAQVPILEDLIEPCIFERENEELIRVPTEEEIRKGWNARTVLQTLLVYGCSKFL